MKAARFYGPGDLRVEETEAPSAGPGEVVIAVVRAGICGTDLHDYVGPVKSVPMDEPHPLTGHKAPVIMGHELSGYISEIGDDVENIKIGDRVTIMPVQSCFKCYYCRRGLYHLCKYQAGTGLQWKWGGFADFLLVKDYMIRKIPDNMTYEQGALVEPTALAVYALERGNFKAGQTVFISGGGPTATLTLLCAKAFGAGAVYMSEVQPGRLKRLKALGADEVFDPRDRDAMDQKIAELTDVGVDLAIECSGSEGGINDCFRLLRKRGMYVQSGLAVGDIKVQPWEWALKDLNMCGIWAWDTNSFDQVIKIISNGMIPVEKLVSRTIQLDDIVKEGFDVLAFDKEGRELKIQVVIREDT
jgi:(R,R)-butanediol dehydrogenase / meso-butanediol dehydrogenase / diacetyl reductase